VKRRSQKRSPALIQLQESFRLEVVFDGAPAGRSLPCFWAAFTERPCSGRINACHVIKRQRIGNALWGYGLDSDLIEMAEWDPRLAVPGCAGHDAMLDNHRVPVPSERLMVFRHELPARVDEGAAHWGLEECLTDRCPFFDPADTSHVSRAVSNQPAHRLAREAVASERELFLD
jgi:hypothetical protein